MTNITVDSAATRVTRDWRARHAARLAALIVDGAPAISAVRLVDGSFVGASCAERALALAEAERVLAPAATYEELRAIRRNLIRTAEQVTVPARPYKINPQACGEHGLAIERSERARAIAAQAADAAERITAAALKVRAVAGAHLDVALTALRAAESAAAARAANLTHHADKLARQITPGVIGRAQQEIAHARESHLAALERRAPVEVLINLCEWRLSAAAATDDAAEIWLHDPPSYEGRHVHFVVAE